MVLAQELKLDGMDKAEAENWCKKNRWKPFISKCRRTPLGNASAGAGVFVRSHLGAAPMEPYGVAICEGWVAAVHIDYAMRGGIVAVAAYFETGEGYGPDSGNWHRCLRIGEFLRAVGRPYIMGADWQEAPQVISSSGWPDSVQGRFMVPEGMGGLP